MSIMQICSNVSAYFFQHNISIIEHLIDKQTVLTHQEVVKKMNDTTKTEI